MERVMTDFSHIRELLAKATPGEWRRYKDGRNTEGVKSSVRPWVCVGAWERDAALIATLRNNAEAMLDRIDKLEAALKALEARDAPHS
jgi:hypothetical protein